MNEWIVSIGAILGGGGLIGGLTSLATSRTEGKKASSADWSGYADRLEQRIDKLQGTLNDAQSELADIREELSTARTKLAAALDHIRAFRRAVDRALWPTLPVEIRDDIGDPPPATPASR